MDHSFPTHDARVVGTKTVRPFERIRNGGPTVRVGDRIRLLVPDNPRLDGSKATIEQLADWGAFLRAPAAASGRFRATWEEMTPDIEYTGDCCTRCGSMSMVQAGKCKVCTNCGESDGCS